MEIAKELLAESPNKIYEISVQLGYQKPSYFIQLFKKHYGMTPQEYRNMLDS
ncbi:CFA/I fimbrial subunit D [compost metagenome]